MEFYKDSNTIDMKAKRWLIGISITIASIFAVLAVTFVLLTNPVIKINGWQELDVQKLERLKNTITVQDADGNVIVEKLYSKNRIYTPIEDIPAQTVNAFIGVEDKRFYSHHGVDYLRMLGAAKNNVLSGSLREGASTITQQLIKNTHLSTEKTFTRKFQEIRIAKALEKVYSKEEILESYLNILYFGNNVYGIGQAAQTYFDKEASELTIAESALLAGIINNPSRYNPITHPEAAKQRRDIVIDCMLRNGKIDATAASTAKAEPLRVLTARENSYGTYMENMIADAAGILDCLPEEVFEKKATIVSNLKTNDFRNIFQSMSRILHESKYNIRVMVVDNAKGQIVFDAGNVRDSVQMRRQPGSAIKPFVAYAPALEKKLVYPVSVIRDEKTNFGGYEPQNFNNKYYGDITVAESLINSLNIPAVKLTDMCGLPYAKATAMRFGIRFDEKDTGLAVALGGMTNGVALSDLADAYATLANAGMYRKSHYVRAVYADGKLLYESEKGANSTRAVGEDTAFLITDMLRQCAQTGTAKKLQALPNVAAKTGTVERGEINSDAYCVAYTPLHTVAVWCGSNQETEKLYGGREPTDLAKVVLEILNDSGTFSVPESVEKLDVDVKKLQEEKTVYLAAPTLAKRYRIPVYFSKRNLPTKFSYGEMPFWWNDDPFTQSNGDDFEIVERLFD